MYDEKLKGQTDVFDFLTNMYKDNAKQCKHSEKDFCRIKQKFIRYNVNCPCEGYTGKE